jgi:hypothetical protein
MTRKRGRTTRLRETIANPETRAKYNFGVGLRSNWKPGSRLEMSSPPPGEGAVLETEYQRQTDATEAELA